MRSLATALLFAFLVLQLFSQEKTQPPTHGTVNIVLANRNGLVAETDSMLSYTKSTPLGPEIESHPQPGRKLYRADDHTVILIANFFSDRGPSFPSGEYPGNTIIRSLTLRYIHHRQASSTISQQLDEFSQYVALELEILAKLHTAMDINPCTPESGCSSMITIAGYENGKPTIGHIEVVPAGINSTTFVATKKTIDVASDHLIYAVYGMSDVALNILEHPQRLRKGNPHLDPYRNSMRKTHGCSLTLDDMKKLAAYLEEMTSATYPKMVGKTPEIAVMQKGHIRSFEPNDKMENELTGEEYRQAGIDVVESFEKVFSGPCPTLKAGPAVQIRGTPYYLVLMNNGTFQCVLQPLDKLVVTNTSFDNSILWYRGDSLSFFGSNNTITNSVLLVAPNVDMSSPFIETFKRNYPSVKIVDRIAE